MKKLLVTFALCMVIFQLSGVTAGATPIDLGTFAHDLGVNVSGSSASFYLQDPFGVESIHSSSFFVPLDAIEISFNYTLDPGVGTIDWFAFTIGLPVPPGGSPLSPILSVTDSVTSSFHLDLTAYQGQTISISWALLWGGPTNSTMPSRASISNVELLTRTSVPEPTTLFLLGGGLLSLCVIRRLQRRLG
ncbi:MAG: PEP-CTERM sorting domain-containing protein [Syntrophobacteraceae bacterium]